MLLVDIYLQTILWQGTCSYGQINWVVCESVHYIIMDFRRTPAPPRLTHPTPLSPHSPSRKALWLQWTVIQIPEHLHLPGPEVGHSHCEKGPAEVVLFSTNWGNSTGAADTVLLSCHWICPLLISNCLVQLSYQIWPQKSTEDSPDCWANHWYNPPHSPRTVLIQSEQKGW